MNLLLARVLQARAAAAVHYVLPQWSLKRVRADRFERQTDAGTLFKNVYQV